MAPAMNAAMWAKPAVQRNVRQVAADGGVIVQPGTGWLSCRQQGTGRMAEPDEIATVIRDTLAGTLSAQAGVMPVLTANDAVSTPQ